MPSGAPTKEDIEEYLQKVRDSIDNHRFHISMNPKRPDNRAFFATYCCTEADAAAICRGLTYRDFSKCEPSRNQHNVGQLLYFFGKKVSLNKRIDDGTGEVEVEIYIKFDLKQSGTTICVSFHQAAFPINYYFNSHAD